MSMMGTAKLYSILLCVHQISVNMTQGFQVKIFNLPDAAIVSMMPTAKLYSLTLCVRQIKVNVAQGSQVQIFYLSVVVLGMACVNDGDCQAVLSNTVCTSNHCECDTWFPGSDFLSFRCCHRYGMCQ